MNVLLKAQSKRGTNILKLLQDVATRCNSQFYMIYRMLEIKESLCIALTQIENVQDITKEEWKILDELVSLLNVLEESTHIFCGDSYSTLSMFIPTINLLIEHTNNKILTHSDGIQFKDSILISIKERFLDAEKS